MELKRPRGTADVLPPEGSLWQVMEDKARHAAALFGFEEVRTPTFEFLPLYVRGVGDATDVVQKEMYTFSDRKDRPLALRPESTAGVMRALIEAKRVSGVQRLFYLQSHFRYERPQAGRMREHHQFGVELVGSEHAAADVEVMALAGTFLQDAGLQGLVFALNSIGCAECRPRYRAALLAFLEGKTLCEDDARRYRENPLRVLDCKKDACVQARAGAPRTLDYLCDDCRAHFEDVKQRLQALEITYQEDPELVRGLDYYQRTVFEVKAPELGAQSTVCGGGRYDGLSESIGGPRLPGVGFGLGLERLMLALSGLNRLPCPRPALSAYVAQIGEETAPYALRLAADLRRHGVRAAFDLSARSLKAQLREAADGRVRFVLILGPQELQAGTCVLRNMEDGSQRTLALGEAAQTVAGEMKEDTR